MCNDNGTGEKNSEVRSMKILDTGMIFARAVALQYSQRNYNIKEFDVA